MTITMQELVEKLRCIVRTTADPHTLQVLTVRIDPIDWRPRIGQANRRKGKPRPREERIKRSS